MDEKRERQLLNEEQILQLANVGKFNPDSRTMTHFVSAYLNQS